jgi:hypothetical protein
MFSYRSSGLSGSYPDIVEIVLRTIDREDLLRDWMKPERELWWHLGIRWIQELIRNGRGKEEYTSTPPRNPHILVIDSTILNNTFLLIG